MCKDPECICYDEDNAIALRDYARLEDENATLRAELERLLDMVEYYKKRDTLHYPIKARMILYNDTIEGEECHRDDIWAVTTQELNEMHDKETILKSDLAAAVELIAKMRGQWVHSMHKDECLELLARMEVRP